MQVSPWGGSEELWSQAALRLGEQGHEIAASVVWWPQLSPKILELSERKVKLLMRKPPRHGTLPTQAWRLLARQFGFEKRAVNRLHKRKADLVVISQGGCLDGLEWMKFCEENSLPFVSIANMNDEASWPSDEKIARAAIALRAARKLFFVSRHNLELQECQIGELLPNATVVWNPFNVRVNQLPAWPNENGAWKLACVARLEPAAKGQDLLLKVLSQPKWKDRPVEINLYGAGHYERSLRQLAKNLNLNNVCFRGHVNGVEKIWEENHLLVLPSRCEGLPIVLVESMWCARPAVVTDVGGNAEVCVDGETGFVATAATVKLLDQALERAWDKRHAWQQMGRAARARAEQLIPTDPVGIFCQQLIECIHMQK